MKAIQLSFISLALVALLSGCASSSFDTSSQATGSYATSQYEIVPDGDWPTSPLNEVTTLDFYSINDFHGAVAYNPSSYELGINRLATYFDVKKGLNPDGTVILAAGDIWQGSADSNITHGRLVTDAMNLIGFDAMAIGNHEFDWGEDTIRSNRDRSDFPLLSSNIFDRRSGQLADFALPYTLIDRSGVRIGIIGTIGATLESSILTSNVMNFDFVPMRPLVESGAAYLRTLGAKAIVLLNHNGEVDSGVLDDVDVVFNAHTHENYKYLTSGTPVLQASYNGKAVGHVRMTYTASSDQLELVSYTVDSSLIGQSLAEQEGMKSLYDGYLDTEINVIKNEVLGTATASFSKAQLGNLAVAEMLAYGATMGAVAAFHNIGGVRDTISSGTVTYGDIYKVFPFDNELMIVEVSGTQLKWWLNQDNYVAGANPTSNTVGGTAIKDSQTYKIIAINYLTEKHITSTDQYPHNLNTAVNTFQYVRELIKAKWQSVGSLNPSNYN